jgi:hypothetical protein
MFVLNLLRSDQLILNASEQNLFSNSIHCFDEHTGYSFVQHFVREQDALSPKLRFKYATVKNFFQLLMNNVQLSFEKNRDLARLPSHDRLSLLRTTVEYTSSIGSLFMLRQYQLFDNPCFYNSVELVFGPTAAASFKRVTDQLDPDDTFIKLILSILAFSTINCTVYTKSDLTPLLTIRTILSTQNMYTDITWRYILFKYGHYDAVIRFSNIIRCLLIVNNTISQAPLSQQFTDIIDFIIKEIEQKFCM